MTDLRCVGKACSDGPPIDGEPAPRLAHPPTLLCQRCEDGLTRRLAEMPATYDLLHNVLLHGAPTAPKLGNSPTKGNPPMPISAAVHDHLVLIKAQVVSWANLVREDRGLHGPDRDEVSSIAGWLLSQVEWIVQQMWVDDMAEEMRDLTRTADGLTQHRARWNRLDSPCPDCCHYERGRWDGHAEVQCGSCGMTWDREAFLQAEADRHTLTATAAAAWLEIAPATFRGYVTSKAITSIGKDRDGLSRYAVEDVARLDTREEKTA
ncbi:MAG: hypothetical protein JWO69_2016 [Thermoleophilia bacterium]|nr:hypothetical protein [Thermoleophilia bacterium]